METTLKLIFETTLYSSIVIIIVLLIKTVAAGKISSKIMSFLWVLVLVRLIMPINIESPVHIDSFSSVPTAEQQSIVSKILNESLGNEYIGFSNTTLQPTAQTSVDTFVPVQAEQTPTFFERAFEWIKGINVWSVIFIVWLIGIAVFMSKNIVELIFFCKRVKRGDYEVDAKLTNAINYGKTKLGIARNVKITVSKHVEIPVTFGLIKPKILIPDGLEHSLSEDKLRLIIMHELCHIKRFDILRNYIWLIAKAVHWFNPIVWIAYKNFNSDRELACDEMVLKRVGEKDKFEYSQSLLDVMKLSEKSLKAPSILSFCEDKSKLRQRVESMIKPMRKSKSAGTIALLLAAVMVFMCFTTACQPTQEKQAAAGIDYNNDQEKMTETDQEKMTETTEQGQTLESEQDNIPLSESLGVPQRYTSDIIVDKLNITADAPVVFPDTDRVPVYKISAADFTQEQVDGLIDILFDGETIYEWEFGPVWTKARVEEMLSIWRQRKASTEGEFATEEGQTWCDRVIEIWEQKYLTAPEENNAIVSDGKLKSTDLINHETGEKAATYSGLIVFTDDNSDVPAGMLIENNNDLQEAIIYEDGGRKSLERDATLTYSIHDDNDYNYWQTPSIPVDQDTVITDEKVLEKLKITPRQAQALVENALKQAGIDYMVLHSMSLVDNANYGSVDGIVSQASLYAYRMQFIRAVDGMRCVYKDVTTLVYAPVWNFETLDMYVDDRGIISLEWRSPLEVKDDIIIDAQMLPFDSISEKFEDAMQTKYGSIESVYTTINVEWVSLELIRIVDQNSIENGRLVPVWNFYGTKTVAYDNSEQLSADLGVSGSLLIINAIDGSTTILERGY